MLETYLEKSIFRQVYICEQLHEKGTIQIREIADQLNVCPLTVTNDLECITDILHQQIISVEKARSSFTVAFDSSFSRLALTQLIYQRSDFFNVLGHYLSGEHNWSNIADTTFISLSKVYNLRNELIDFFKQMQYLNADGHFEIPEKDYRSLLLTIIYETNRTELIQLNQSIIQSGQQLIDYVEKHFFSRSYPTVEKQFILLGIAIGLQRSKTNPIYFSQEEKRVARHTPLFQLIQKGVEQLSFSLCHDEDECFYIYFLFNSRNYLCDNFELLQKDLNVVYQNHVADNPLVIELSQKLILSLNISEENQILFDKALLPFIRSLWADIQIFQPDKTYLLNEEQRALYLEVHEILEQWRKQNNLFLRWNENSIRKLTISLSLLNEHKQKSPIEVFIVAPSDFRYLYYRQQLEDILGEHFSISNIICKQLREIVDDTFFCTQRIILCDSSLYQEGLGSEKTIIYPITFQTIHTVIDQLNKQI